MGHRVGIDGRRRKVVGSVGLATVVALGLLAAPAAGAAKPGKARFAAIDPITLKVSSESDLRPSTTLERATVSGRIYVFAVVSGKAESVRFFLDDKQRQSTPLSTDRRAPFRLHTTTSSAAGLDTTTLRTAGTG